MLTAFLMGSSPAMVISRAVMESKRSALYLRTMSADSRFQPDLRDSAEISGAKEVYLIHEPMAAAIGMGIEVQEPRGNMIIDIGGGTTEIAVLSLGGIVKDKSIKVAGDIFTSDIEYFMRKSHNLVIGERSAERIKIEVGSALENLEDTLQIVLLRLHQNQVMINL